MQRETRIAHWILGALSAVSLVLLSLPLSSPVRSFKAALGYVLDPLRYEGEIGTQRLAAAPARVRALLIADMENARLREELRAQAWVKSSLEAVSLENERLRKALALSAPAGRVAVWARVMERDPLHWHRSMTIDAGADKGLSPNDPVLGRRGEQAVVVGRVVEVRPSLSIVLLASDERSAVAAYLSTGTLEGLVQGQDGPRLRMNYLNAEAQLVSGDSVYTSPTSATFPPDVLIGRVAKVYPRDPFLTFQSVEVEPAVDASSLQEVMVLRLRAPAPAPSSGGGK